MKSLVAAAAACTLGLVACVQTDEAPQELARAIPTADQVSIKLPDTKTRAVGDLANWYVSTRDVTRTLNGGSAWVLILIHTIVQFPVTTVNGETYTWGPWSDALDPAEYKLEVRAVGDGTYEYHLSGRSKTQSGSQFEVVIDGSADPRAGDDKGSGEFSVDFDASKRVNPIDSGDAKGSMHANYDLAKGHLDLTIMSTDGAGKPVVADYAYNAAPGGGGDMVFEIATNVGGGPVLESVTLRSRWQGTGAGRADARISGGDVAAITATASECWDTSFRRVFYVDSGPYLPSEGTQSACVFATADLPLPR